MTHWGKGREELRMPYHERISFDFIHAFVRTIGIVSKAKRMHPDVHHNT